MQTITMVQNGDMERDLDFDDEFENKLKLEE